MNTKETLTKQEAWKFCIDRMDNLYTDRHKKQGGRHHFGKQDVGDLLDLIYGKENDTKRKARRSRKHMVSDMDNR